MRLAVCVAVCVLALLNSFLLVCASLDGASIVVRWNHSLPVYDIFDSSPSLVLAGSILMLQTWSNVGQSGTGTAYVPSNGAVAYQLAPTLLSTNTPPSYDAASNSLIGFNGTAVMVMESSSGALRWTAPLFDFGSSIVAGSNLLALGLGVEFNQMSLDLASGHVQYNQSEETTSGVWFVQADEQLVVQGFEQSYFLTSPTNGSNIDWSDIGCGAYSYGPPTGAQTAFRDGVFYVCTPPNDLTPLSFVQAYDPRHGWKLILNATLTSQCTVIIGSGMTEILLNTDASVGVLAVQNPPALVGIDLTHGKQIWSVPLPVQVDNNTTLAMYPCMDGDQLWFYEAYSFTDQPLIIATRALAVDVATGMLLASLVLQQQILDATPQCGGGVAFLLMEDPTVGQQAGGYLIAIEVK